MSDIEKLRQAMVEARIMLEYDPPEIEEARRLLREGLYPKGGPQSAPHTEEST